MNRKKCLVKHEFPEIKVEPPSEDVIEIECKPDINQQTDVKNKRQKCPLCHKSFKLLDLHLQIHANHVEPKFAPFQCALCSKCYSSEGSLSMHLRTHTQTKLYACEMCSKSFTQLINLTHHKRTHTGEKPFACSYCPKKFAQSGNLSAHVRVHLKLKPYRCEFCEKCFTQSSNLRSHLKNNHYNGAPPFSAHNR